MHRRWLAGLKFEQAVHHLVLEDYVASGASFKRGGLTKAGNSATRRLLIEAAWCYRFPARVSRELLLRQAEQPKPIREIAWKAEVRLCARYRTLARGGKPANVVTAAIVRELTGFIWAIAQVLIRSPARFGISDAATTMHSCPRADNSRCRP
jgi:hypothetical protein